PICLKPLHHIRFISRPRLPRMAFINSAVEKARISRSTSTDRPEWITFFSARRCRFKRLTDGSFSRMIVSKLSTSAEIFLGASCVAEPTFPWRGGIKIMATLLPLKAAGYSIAHEAKTSFTARNGILHTDDFEVAGRLFSMVGDGDIHFLDDKLDFNIRIEPKGAGVLLTPVYKLFEYKG